MALTDSDLTLLVAQAGDLDTSGLICRNRGHRWDDGITRRAPGGFEDSNICERCRTERYRFLSRAYYIESSWRYVYPPGYKVKGLGVLNEDHRASLRRELDERRNAIAQAVAVPAPRAEAAKVDTRI